MKKGLMKIDQELHVKQIQFKKTWRMIKELEVCESGYMHDTGIIRTVSGKGICTST